METLLNVVNNILEDMGRDKVNSLDATPEASRVVNILKDTYSQLLTRNLWEHKHAHLPLQGASDVTKPTKLLLDAGIIDIKEVLYNKEGNWQKLVHVYPEEFLRIVQMRNLTDPDLVVVQNDDGVELRIGTREHPTYWTSFDEKTIYLDSWRQSLSSTVAGNSAVAHVVVYPAFPQQEQDVFDIPVRHMPMFVAWARSICFEKIKQIVSTSDQYWSRASYGRFLHDGSRVGQDRPQRKTYGKRRR
jgi:hypothetical protein